MKDFISNQIAARLNLTRDSKINSRTLPQVSVGLFKSIAPEFVRLFAKRRKGSKKPLKLGYPISLGKFTGKRLLLYDINSLYPFCLTNRFPFSSNNTDNREKITISEVVITPPNFSRNSYFLAPHPRNRAFCSSQEISLLKKLDYTLTLTDQLKLPYKTNMFLDFVIHLFSRKKDHPKLIKHLLNSFYGRLALCQLSNIEFLTLQLMLSYSRVHTYTTGLDQNNISFYTDTDSFTLQHPLTAIPSQKLGYCKNLLFSSKIKTTDEIVVTSPRNYSYA